MLDAVRKSTRRGDLIRSELLRLLIHGEHRRRQTGRSAVPMRVIDTENRTGRPRALKSRAGSCVAADAT